MQSLLLSVFNAQVLKSYEMDERLHEYYDSITRQGVLEEIMIACLDRGTLYKNCNRKYLLEMGTINSKIHKLRKYIFN